MPGCIYTGNKTSHFNTPISVIETVQQLTLNSKSKTDIIARARYTTYNVEHYPACTLTTICSKSLCYKNLVNLSLHKRFAS